MKNKRIVVLIVTLLTMMLLLSGGFMMAFAQNQESKSIIFFYGQGCSHCANVEEFFEDENIYDKYLIDSREIYFNRDNAVYFNDVLSSLDVPLEKRGVPTVVIGQKVISGDSPIIENFVAEAEAYLLQSPDGEELIVEESDDSSLTIWAVVSASLVDAINPCAFAVLIILLSAVLMKKSKKEALISGLSFSLAIFISYMLMGLGLYTAINAVGITSIFTTIVGILAIVLGLLNLKDYFWYGKAFIVEVPRSWRPKMKGLIQGITSPGGAFFTGILVSLFLLPCTSGPYIVILGLLAKNSLSSTALGYLLLYNLIFITPMIIITIMAYKGSDIEKLEYYRQANLERLHLVAGLILIGLGVYVLFFF